MPRYRKKRGTDETMRQGAKLITVADPQNVVSEQFRTVRTNINFLGVDKKVTAIGFTSSNISEGKSTVTANIAITSAQAGNRVLLIDTDLRRPTVHSTFDLANNRGLTTILTSNADKIDVSEIVQASGVDNLSVLTSGPIPPNPAELLNSQKMMTTLKELRSYYDVVILDLAPVLEVSDTQVLASQMDGVVLVVRQGVTQKLAVKRAVEMLRLAQVKIFGYVMNDVNASDGGYGYGYGQTKEKCSWFKWGKKKS